MIAKTGAGTAIQNMEQAMRGLKLGGMAKDWKSVEYRSNEQYLSELLDMEIREREANRTNRLTKQAGFKVMKTLDSFVWKQGIEIPPSITAEAIETAGFVDRKENLVLMGASGTGKTHLATAIAVHLCGTGRQAMFHTATGLAGALQEKKQKGALGAFLKSLSKVELLVIDELGFISLHKEASELLFQAVSECYEQRSLIITTNIEFSQWNTVLGDNKLTAALIDRLIHHSHILVFAGPSHRLEESVKRQKGGAAK